MNTKRHRSWPLPRKREYTPDEKVDPLPPRGFFGTDDFMRARFFSAIIERYTTKAETELLVKFAREHRMPGMSFADTLESMGAYLHMGPIEAKDKLIAASHKPREQLEREFRLTAAVHEATLAHGPDGKRIFRIVVETLQALFPGATNDRIKGAIEAGNTPDGFSVPATIEAMVLTESTNPLG